MTDWLIIPAQTTGVKTASALPVNDGQPLLTLCFQAARFCRFFSLLFFSALVNFFLCCIVAAYSF